jgi:hypothetical protein
MTFVAAWLILGLIAGFLIFALAGKANLSIAGGVSVLAIVTGSGLSVFASRAQFEKEKLEHYRQRQSLRLYRAYASAERSRDSANEAKRTTESARLQLREIEEEAARITAQFQRAEDLVGMTRRELQGKAYASFWDHVQGSATLLSTLTSSLRQLGGRLSTYSNTLNGRIHNFPLAPLSTQQLPRVDTIAEELRALVRLGETNFEFAMILEQKKTQMAIMESSASISVAIGELGGGLSRSLDGIRGQLSDAQAASERHTAFAETELSRIEANTAASAATGAKVAQVIDKYQLLDD